MQELITKANIEIATKIVCDYFSLTEEELVGKKRDVPIPFAKKCLTYLLRTERIEYKYITVKLNCFYPNLVLGQKTLHSTMKVDKVTRGEVEYLVRQFDLAKNYNNLDEKITTLTKQLSSLESEINYLKVLKEANTSNLINYGK